MLQQSRKLRKVPIKPAKKGQLLIAGFSLKPCPRIDVTTYQIGHNWVLQEIFCFVNLNLSKRNLFIFMLQISSGWWCFNPPAPINLSQMQQSGKVVARHLRVFRIFFLRFFFCKFIFLLKLIQPHNLTISAKNHDIICCISGAYLVHISSLLNADSARPARLSQWKLCLGFR